MAHHQYWVCDRCKQKAKGEFHLAVMSIPHQCLFFTYKDRRYHLCKKCLAVFGAFFEENPVKDFHNYD